MNTLSPLVCEIAVARDTAIFVTPNLGEDLATTTYATGHSNTFFKWPRLLRLPSPDSTLEEQSLELARAIQRLYSLFISIDLLGLKSSASFDV